MSAASRGSIVPQNTKSTVPPEGEQHCSTAVFAADCAAVARTAACAEECAAAAWKQVSGDNRDSGATPGHVITPRVT